jgi:hypothetical protein
MKKWRTQDLRQDDGVIVATDQEQEWLLPWWWENYRRSNAYPVAFVDYGMSDHMRSWCQERGELIDLLLPDLFENGSCMLHLILLKNEIRPDEGFWKRRGALLKKPLACLQSPFQRTVWMDLDCEVMGSIKELFETYCQPLSMAKIHPQPESLLYPTYNSGVIAFEHGIPIIEEWADWAIDHNFGFMGDQDILSFLIDQRKCIVEMPRIYNWTQPECEMDPMPIVRHWTSTLGKQCIRHRMGFP